MFVSPAKKHPDCRFFRAKKPVKQLLLRLFLLNFNEILLFFAWIACYTAVCCRRRLLRRNWNWNGSDPSANKETARNHQHQTNHKKTRRSGSRSIITPLILFALFGRPIIRLATTIVRSLAHGLTSGLSAILSVFGSAFRATSGTAILGGLAVGVILGLYIYKHYFNRSKDAEPEEENFAEEAEKPAADPVPIPMTLGNTPSSDTEEYIPKTNYFSRN